MPGKKSRPGKASTERYPQITFRFSEIDGQLIEDHMRARDLRSKAAVLKQALHLYFALDLPNETIERIVSVSKSYRRPVGDLFENQIDELLE